MEFIGLVAGVLTSVSFIPQAVKVIRTRNTESISLVTYSFFCVGVMLWIGYGLVQQLPAIYICNSITLFPAIIVLSVKISNCKKESRFKDGKNRMG